MRESATYIYATGSFHGGSPVALGVVCRRHQRHATAAPVRHAAASHSGTSPSLPAGLCPELSDLTTAGASHAEGSEQGHVCAAIHRMGRKKVARVCSHKCMALLSM